MALERSLAEKGRYKFMMKIADSFELVYLEAEFEKKMKDDFL